MKYPIVYSLKKLLSGPYQISPGGPRRPWPLRFELRHGHTAAAKPSAPAGDDDDNFHGGNGGKMVENIEKNGGCS